jgi:plasmid stabilization system protein ParE
MKNGYKIFWTNHALSELEETIAYLEENWTAQELEKFAKELDHTLELISKNPKIFQISFKGKNFRRAVVAKFNSLYYRIHNASIEILSFFSNRQDPSKIKID